MLLDISLSQTVILYPNAKQFLQTVCIHTIFSVLKHQQWSIVKNAEWDMPDKQVECKIRKIEKNGNVIHILENPDVLLLA